METTQDCYLPLWTNHGSSTPQNSNCTHTLTSNLKNHPKWTTHGEHCLGSKDKLKQYSLMETNTWMHQCWPTGKELNIFVLCRHWMQFRGPARTDVWWGWTARVNKLWAICTTWWWWWYIYIYMCLCVSLHTKLYILYYIISYII